MGTKTRAANSIDIEAARKESVEPSRTEYKEAPTLRDLSMQTFVAEQNISRFVDQFQVAHDLHTRETLQKLMLEEEDRFASNSERLEKIEQRIKECKARIDNHERLVHKARINGHNVKVAERVLNNLIELREVFWTYHQSVLVALNRSKL